jgi:hypothetical protein
LPPEDFQAGFGEGAEEVLLVKAIVAIGPAELRPVAGEEIGSQKEEVDEKGWRELHELRCIVAFVAFVANYGMLLAFR